MNFYYFQVDDLEIICGENFYFLLIFYKGERFTFLEHYIKDGKLYARFNKKFDIPLTLAGFIVDF